MYYWYKYIPSMDEEIIAYVFVNNSNHLIWFQSDSNNEQYQQYLVWLEEGNTPEEWNPDNIDNGTE